MKLQSYPNSVFLTGATGVLGGRILKDLLQSTSSHIYCLVRGKTPSECMDRVRSLLRVYDYDESLDADLNSRVTVLQGDVAQDDFGLSPHVFNQLQDITELTIHAAANTSLLLGFKTLEPINVNGTRRVIEFCLGTRQKNLSYISTYTVMGNKTFDSSFQFSEQDYEVGQKFEHLNYQRSKFLAEGLVRQARERGLKWRIFRPGQIYGDSVTGAYPQSETQVSGLFYDLFKTAIETRVMPESYIHYDVVPVDYVSRAIVGLSAGSENMFDVYHLINPDVKKFSQVMALLNDLGYEINLLPEEIYKQRLRAGEITKDGEPYTSIMLRAFSRWYFISKISFYDSAMTKCEFTRSKLKRLGIACPPIDARLMETYVNAGIQSSYFPKPSSRLQVSSR